MKTTTNFGIAAIYGGKYGIDGFIFNKIIHELKNYNSNSIHINLFTQTGKNQTYKSKDVTISHHIIDFPFLPNILNNLLFSLMAVFQGAAKSKNIIFLDKVSTLFLPIVKFFPKRNSFVAAMPKSFEQQQLMGNKIIGQLGNFFTARHANTIIFSDIKAQTQFENKYNKQTEVIAFGADHTVPIENIGSALLDIFPFFYGRYAFASIDVEDLISTPAILEAYERFENYPLAVFGNWEDSEFGIALKKRYADCPNIKVFDKHTSQGTLNFIRSKCYVYLHGNEKGGGSLPLMEAMFAALPIIAFDVAHNRELTHNQAIYFKDVDGLYDILNDTEPNKLSENGEKMYMVSRDEYQWKRCVEQYIHTIDKNLRACFEKKDVARQFELIYKAKAMAL